jgi:hypothetical protein
MALLKSSATDTNGVQDVENEVSMALYESERQFRGLSRA